VQDISFILNIFKFLFVYDENGKWEMVLFDNENS
jgi:hypothetical protein